MTGYRSALSSANPTMNSACTSKIKIPELTDNDQTGRIICFEMFTPFVDSVAVVFNGCVGGNGFYLFVSAGFLFPRQ